MSVDKEKHKVGAGRPSYEPNEYDEGKLTAFLSIGFPHTLISLYMRKDINTLKKYYGHLFETIMPTGDKTANVEASLYYSAVFKHNVVACLAWLRAHKKEMYNDYYIKKGSEMDQGIEETQSNFLKAISDVLNGAKQ